MKTAVIYARYSSERQTEQSIEGQVRECEEFAARNDIVIVKHYIDRATTGTNDNRNSFQQMLKDSAKRAWEIVLVYKLDRFSRNKYEMAIHKKTLRDNGVRVLSAKENIPDTPEGIILESLLEGMAEYYSAELSQKVRRGMRESRMKGNFSGGYVLFGFRVENKKVVIHPEEGKIVSRIFHEYDAGKPVKTIVQELSEEGVLNRGKPLALNTVHHLLANEKYAGLYHYNGELFTNIYPAIVPLELFERVRRKIEENRYGHHPKEIFYLLKNKMRCGYCGHPISSETGTSKAGKVMRYYKCAGRKKKGICHKAVVRKDTIENLVVDTTLALFDDPDAISDIANKILEAAAEFDKTSDVVTALRAEEAETQKAIDNIMSAIEQGIITSTTKQRLEALEEKKQHISERLMVEDSRSRAALDKNDIIRFLKKALKKEPRQMIYLIVKEVVLYDDKIEITYNFIDKNRPDAFKHRAFLLYSQDLDLEILKLKKANCFHGDTASISLFI